MKKTLVSATAIAALAVGGGILTAVPASAVTNHTVACTNQGDTYVTSASVNSNRSTETRIRLDRADAVDPTMIILAKISCTIPAGDTSPTATAVRATADTNSNTIGSDVLKSQLVNSFNPTTVTWANQPSGLTGASEDTNSFVSVSRTIDGVPTTVKQLNGTVDGSTVTLPSVAPGVNTLYFQFYLSAGTTGIAGISSEGATGGYQAPAFSLDYSTP